MSNAPKILINGTDPEQEKIKVPKGIFKIFPAYYITYRLTEILIEEGIVCKQWSSIIRNMDSYTMYETLIPFFDHHPRDYDKEVLEETFIFYGEYIISQLEIAGIKNIPTYRIRKLFKDIIEGLENN